MEGDRGREPGRTGGGRGMADGRRKTRKDGKRDLNEGGKQEKNSKRKAFVIFFTEDTNMFRLPFNSSETLNFKFCMRENENSSSG